jgi:hypothetical protein
MSVADTRIHARWNRSHTRRAAMAHAAHTSTNGNEDSNGIGISVALVGGPCYSFHRYGIDEAGGDGLFSPPRP